MTIYGKICAYFIEYDKRYQKFDSIMDWIRRTIVFRYLIGIGDMSPSLEWIATRIWQQ